jgi:membrane protein DedA with SNARE-associated domain/rhodanese-related sulfurtransferase
MALPEHILLTYGYILLFAWVLVEQCGIPLPATPVLLAAGALSAENELSISFSFLAAFVATLIADSSWFFIGRNYGHYVLRILCKLSIEPTTCVRTTQDSFTRRRAVTLMIAKFVPGLSTLAPPIAGKSGMAYRRFLVFDGIGATLWVGALLIAGRLFGDLLRHNPKILDWAGNFSGALLGLGIAGFIVARYIRRRMILRQWAQARLEPHELKSWLDAGERVYIVDLRSRADLEEDPYTLPGAHHHSPQSLAEHRDEIPADHEIVLYCDCPSEATAAKTALTLHRLGIEGMRPLRGGYGEWKRLGFPLEAFEPVLQIQTAGLTQIQQSA